uniref:Uncharacterized protein n=1 Tax=Anopheles melas TaxID=34690 RepID=A0A182UGV2_9DIPT
MGREALDRTSTTSAKCIAKVFFMVVCESVVLLLLLLLLHFDYACPACLQVTRRLVSFGEANEGPVLNGGPLVASGKVAAGGGSDTQTVLVTERREVAEGRESSKGNHVGEERRGYDMSRKRCSISVQQHGTDGTVVRTNYRELSPASLRIHRKSSHDIRNTLLGPDGEVLHLHDPSGKGGDGIAKMPAVVKPIKLKSLITKAESYDTMHGKATDVSSKCSV